MVKGLLGFCRSFSHTASDHLSLALFNTAAVTRNLYLIFAKELDHVFTFHAKLLCQLIYFHFRHTIYLLYAALVLFRIHMFPDPFRQSLVQYRKRCAKLFSHCMPQGIFITVKTDRYFVILTHILKFLLCIL